MSAIAQVLGLVGPLDAIGLAVAGWLFVRFMRATSAEARVLKARIREQREIQDRLS